MNRGNLPTHGDVGRPGPWASRPTAQGPMIRDREGFHRPGLPYPHRDERHFRFPDSPMSMAAEMNRSMSDFSLRSGAAGRRLFTQAVEEALTQHNNLAVPRAGLPQGLGDPLFRDGMGRAHLARQDVREGRATRLPPAVTPRAANQDFNLGYRGLQDPFGQDFGRPQLHRNNAGSTRDQAQIDTAETFFTHGTGWF